MQWSAVRVRAAQRDGVVFAGAEGGGYVFPIMHPAYDALLCPVTQTLKRVITMASGLGYEMNAGPEAEFFLFGNVRYDAIFEDAGGLMPGDFVTLAGVGSGTKYKYEVLGLFETDIHLIDAQSPSGIFFTARAHRTATPSPGIPASARACGTCARRASGCSATRPCQAGQGSSRA